MPKAELVQIQRGKYSPTFQVARARMSMASAVVHQSPKSAVRHIEDAVEELNGLIAEIYRDLQVKPDVG